LLSLTERLARSSEAVYGTEGRELVHGFSRTHYPQRFGVIGLNPHHHRVRSF